MLIKDNPFIEGRSQSFSENQKIAERNSQSGFSLIELLIAVVLFTIVITSAYGLLEAARGSRSVVNQQVQTMQSARNALNTFGRDVLNAGYGDFRQSGNGAYMPDGTLPTLLALPAATNGQPDNLTTIVPGDNITLNSLSNVQTDQITFLFQDITFNTSKSLNVVAGGITSNGSRVEVQSPGGAACRVNDLVIVSTTSASALGMVTGIGSGSNSNRISFNSGDLLSVNGASGNNSPIGLLSNTGAVFTRVTLVTYKVLANGTLVRTTYGNNPTGADAASQKQEVPLVYGVENMVIEYILANGQALTNPPLASMQNVRQIRITLTIQSQEKNVRTNQPIRINVSSTFNTRNLNYDRS